MPDELIDWTKPKVYDDWWKTLTVGQKSETYWKMGDVFASQE